MLNFILADANIPFAIALALLLIIALVEGLGALVGVGVGSALDSLLPDFSDFDTSRNLNVHDLGSESSLARLLGWLRVGRIPLLIVLVVFLFCFASLGLFINGLVSSIAGVLLPKLASVPLALLLALPATRTGAGMLERILPKDETSSVSLDTLIGREARITLGEASDSQEAEAKVFDQFGKAHYIMVVAESGHGPLKQDAPLLLVRRDNNRFIAIAASS